MPTIDRWVAALATREARAATRASTTGALHLSRFRDWYDRDAVDALVGQLGDLAVAASRTAAAANDAFLVNVAREHDGSTSGTAGVIDLSNPLRHGVGGWSDVYRRPVVRYRYLQSIGYPDDPALSAAIDQFDAMVRTDVALARRSQGRESLSALGYDRYRRVIRPYASSGGTCGLCVAASDRVYTTDQLLPIHSRCKCLVLPIVSDEFDPGGDLNDADLGAIYTAADDEVARAAERGAPRRGDRRRTRRGDTSREGEPLATSRRALRATRVRYTTHPELGPVLDVAHRSAA